MSHFTQEAIEIQTENMKQEEINESCRRAWEFDDNSSEDNESISSQERFSMDSEQADKIVMRKMMVGLILLLINQSKRWKIYSTWLL